VRNVTGEEEVSLSYSRDYKKEFAALWLEHAFRDAVVEED